MGCPNAPGPRSVAVDNYYNVYVGDLGNNRVVKVAPDATRTTIGSGFTPPPPPAYPFRLCGPQGPQSSGGLGR